MFTHPNNTSAQYITNLPRRISLSGIWECGLTEIHYLHDWYNVRNARLRVEHDGKVETSRVFGSFDVCTSLLHRRFQAWFRIAIHLFEHHRTAPHRRRQDCTAATNSADNRKTRGDGDGPFRPSPVHSRAESRIRQHRNRDNGRHGPTSAIRTWEACADDWRAD